MDIESDQLLLFALAAAALTVLLGILVIAVRTRRIVETLSDMDAMKRTLQKVQLELADNPRIPDRTFVENPVLPGLGLHLRQIKREQLRLSEAVKMISSEMETFGHLLKRRDKSKRDQRREIRELVETSRSLQEWKSRMTAVYSDGRHLFDSELIRELMEGFSPEAMHVAQPIDGSEESATPSQQRGYSSSHGAQYTVSPVE